MNFACDKSYLFPSASDNFEETHSSAPIYGAPSVYQHYPGLYSKNAGSQSDNGPALDDDSSIIHDFSNSRETNYSTNSSRNTSVSSISSTESIENVCSPRVAIYKNPNNPLISPASTTSSALPSPSNVL